VHHALGEVTHDDNAVAEAGEFFEDGALAWGRLGEDGVEGGNDGHAQGAREFKDMTAVFAAENAVFVLEKDAIDLIDVEEIGGGDVFNLLVLGDLEADFVGIIIAGGVVVDGDDTGLALAYFSGDRVAQIFCESGDATLTGNITAHEGDGLYRS
jgi:hypothetical protein